jgi:hypothetical protein
VGRRIGVGGSVVEDDELVIAVHCLANGQKHDSTGADSDQNERGYRSASQLLVDVSGGEAPTRVLRTVMSCGSGARLGSSWLVGASACSAAAVGTGSVSRGLSMFSGS